MLARSGRGPRDVETTFMKMGNKTMSCTIDYLAFSSYTYCRKNVVPRAHDISDSRFVQLIDHCDGSQLQFVFEYYESNKVEVRFRVTAKHCLHLFFVQVLDVFSCKSNYPKASMSVEAEELIVVHGYC